MKIVKYLLASYLPAAALGEKEMSSSDSMPKDIIIIYDKTNKLEEINYKSEPEIAGHRSLNLITSSAGFSGMAWKLPSL